MAQLNAANRIVSLTPNQVELVVDTPRAALLVTPFPRATTNWKGRLDDAEARFVPVNGSFLGLRVPPGRHRVGVSYFSERLIWSFRTTAGTAVVLLALAAWWGVRRWRGRFLAAMVVGGAVALGGLGYALWERGFRAQASAHAVLNHDYEGLLARQIERWRGGASPGM
jgi:hypothetical protein